MEYFVVDLEVITSQTNYFIQKMNDYCLVFPRRYYILFASLVHCSH